MGIIRTMKLYFNKDITGYYIDDKGKKTILDGKEDKLLLFGINIVKLKIPLNTKILYCWNNQLTSLTLNDNLITLWCYNNKINSLILNDNLEELYCDMVKISNINKKTYIQLIV